MHTDIVIIRCNTTRLACICKRNCLKAAVVAADRNILWNWKWQWQMVYFERPKIHVKWLMVCVNGRGSVLSSCNRRECFMSQCVYFDINSVVIHLFCLLYYNSFGGFWMQVLFCIQQIINHAYSLFKHISKNDLNLLCSNNKLNRLT